MGQKYEGSLVGAYFQLISSSFEELGKSVASNQVESLAIFLTRTMGSESRDYHRPEHSLDVARGLPPIARLAALFHDIVYVQVDPTWQSNLKPLLRPFEITNDLKVNVASTIEYNLERWLKTVAIIFGVETETELTTMKGLNEFLSTIVMINKLSPFLNESELIKAIACIESTIPFRRIDQKGLTPSDRLEARLRLAFKSSNIGQINDKFLKDIIAECRCIVEKDLASFGSETPADYLSDTWRVIFENNASVRNSFFSIIEYRKAIYGTYCFLNGLHPSFLFWINESKPTSRQLELRDNAERNLKVATEYLRSNIISAAILEAIAVETGGDAPYEMFAGPLKRSREHKPVTTDLYLPEICRKSPYNDLNKSVIDLLSNGRSLRSRFDRKDSPLALYFYKSLEDDAIENTWSLRPLFCAKKGMPE